MIRKKRLLGLAGFILLICGILLFVSSLRLWLNGPELYYASFISRNSSRMIQFDESSYEHYSFYLESFSNNSFIKDSGMNYSLKTKGSLTVYIMNKQEFSAYENNLIQGYRLAYFNSSILDFTYRSHDNATYNVVIENPKNVKVTANITIISFKIMPHFNYDKIIGALSHITMGVIFTIIGVVISGPLLFSGLKLVFYTTRLPYTKKLQSREIKHLSNFNSSLLCIVWLILTIIVFLLFFRDVFSTSNDIPTYNTLFLDFSIRIHLYAYLGGVLPLLLLYISASIFANLIIDLFSYFIYRKRDRYNEKLSFQHWEDFKMEIFSRNSGIAYLISVIFLVISMYIVDPLRILSLIAFIITISITLGMSLSISLVKSCKKVGISLSKIYYIDLAGSLGSIISLMFSILFLLITVKWFIFPILSFFENVMIVDSSLFLIMPSMEILFSKMLGPYAVISNLRIITSDIVLLSTTFTLILALVYILMLPSTFHYKDYYERTKHLLPSIIASIVTFVGVEFFIFLLDLSGIYGHYVALSFALASSIITDLLRRYYDEIQKS